MKLRLKSLPKQSFTSIVLCVHGAGGKTSFAQNNIIILTLLHPNYTAWSSSTRALAWLLASGNRFPKNEIGLKGNNSKNVH